MNVNVTSEAYVSTPWSLAERLTDGVYEVDTRWVETYGSQYQLVDIRNLADFSGPLGHIEGAELIPVSALEQLVQEWSLDTPLVLLCNDGKLAAEAAAMLRDMGYKQVAVMKGGMREWNSQNRPVSFNA